MTALLFYNNSMIVSTQKKAYESYKIVDELRDRSEDLTEYIRSFVISGDPRYEEAFWQVFNFRNGITIGPDGRKTSINALMKQLGFTNYELQKLKEAQANSDMLVKKEAMAINAVKRTPDDNISKLIKPNESKRDFAIRVINDESYNHDKANVINPINNVIQLVDKRTQIELMHYNIFNFIFILVTFVIVLLLFIRFIFLINNIKLHVEREKVIREIVEIMRSSIDINSVKSEVVREIGVYLKADRVFFADYDSVNLDFSISESSEYKSSENIKSYARNKMTITQGIVGAIKKFPFSGKDLIFSDLDKHIEENNINEPEIEICFRDMGCIAMMLMHINYGESFYGDIVVTFEKKREITNDDINFVKTLANQAGIAMYQAELYKKSQFQTEREKLIANIITKSLSTVHINQIKHLVKDIGVITNADRCYFVEIDLENMKGKPIDYEGEYLASSDIKSIIGYDFPTEDVNKFIEIFLETKNLSIFDYEELIKDKSEEYAGINRYANIFGLKNCIAIPFYYMNNLTSVLVIEYIRVKTIPSIDDLDFLRILGNQVGLAFSRIQNYKDTLKIAAREKTLRKIMLDTVSTFDTNEIIKLMVVETGKLLNADRCFFSKFDIENDVVLPAPEYSEYLSGKDIEPLFCKPITKEETDAFVTGLKQMNAVIIEDVNKTDLPEITKKMLIEKFSVKSYLILPVIYKNTLYGALVLHYVKDFRHFAQDEIDVAMAIANQSAIVLHQTELHP